MRYSRRSTCSGGLGDALGPSGNRLVSSDPAAFGVGSPPDAVVSVTWTSRGLASAEMGTFVGLFAGGMAGAVGGFLFAGADGLMFGVLAGSTLGAAVSFRRR